MADKKESIVASLERVLARMIPIATNRWVSVKEFSIVKALKEEGLNEHFSTPLQVSLGKKGLFFSEGSRAQFRFTIKSAVIPDFKALAEEIYLIWQERSKKNATLEGYPYSRPSDLRPKRARRNKSLSDLGSQTHKIKRMIILPNLNDSVFIIHEGLIHQAIITGIRRSFMKSAPGSKNPSEIYFECAIATQNQEGEQEFTIIQDLSPIDIFQSVDSAAAFIAKRTVFLPKNIRF